MSVHPGTENIPEQVIELLSHGGGLGTIFSYTENEYEAMYALGHSHYSQERYLDAAKCFGFLVAHNALEPRFMNAFASCMQMLKQYEDAIQYYSTASVLDLEDPLPTFHTAECFMALAMPAQACEALALVIAQCDAPPWAELRQRAQTLLDLLSRDGAVATPTDEECSQ